MDQLHRKVFALTAACALVLTGCSNSESDSTDAKSNEKTSAAEKAEPTQVELEDNNGKHTIKLPAQRIAALDNRTFEVFDQWGLDLVAVPKGLVGPGISYKTNDDLLDLGMHFEPNLDNLVASKPDLIVSGQRFVRKEPDIKKVLPDTPMLNFEPREGKDFAEELRREVLAYGELFNKQDDAKKLVEDFDKSIERAKAAYKPDMKAMGLLVSGGKIAYIAPHNGRTFGPLFDMIGLTPALEVEGAGQDQHGDDISVEAIAQANPDLVFVMDRDAPLKSAKKPEYVPAKEAIENSAALKHVTAVENGTVYYAPNDTYLNESIITYTEMLGGIADMLEASGK